MDSGAKMGQKSSFRGWDLFLPPKTEHFTPDKKNLDLWGWPEDPALSNLCYQFYIKFYNMRSNKIETAT